MTCYLVLSNNPLGSVRFYRISHHSHHVHPFCTTQMYSSFCLEYPRVLPHTLILGLKNSSYKTHMSHPTVKTFLTPSVTVSFSLHLCAGICIFFFSFNLPRNNCVKEVLILFPLLRYEIQGR